MSGHENKPALSLFQREWHRQANMTADAIARDLERMLARQISPPIDWSRQFKRLHEDDAQALELARQLAYEKLATEALERAGMRVRK